MKAAAPACRRRHSLDYTGSHTPLGATDLPGLKGLGTTHVSPGPKGARDHTKGQLGPLLRSVFWVVLGCLSCCSTPIAVKRSVVIIKLLKEASSRMSVMVIQTVY